MKKNDTLFTTILIVTSIVFISCKKDENTLVSIPKNGLVAYYSFNGHAADSTENNLDCICNASLTADRFGNNNKAYHFNGVNQYIDLPSSPKLKLQFPFSISFWVKPDQIDNSRRVIILSTCYDLINYYGAWFSISPSGYIIISYGSGENSLINSTRSKVGNTLLHSDQWYHITGVFASNSILNIYVNGVKEGDLYWGSQTNLVYASNIGTIGRGKDDEQTILPYFFNGSLDEISFYYRALTDNEINTLYNVK